MRTAVLVALAALAAGTWAAAAAAVDDRAATPLERGAFVAMPAVYDLFMDQRVDAIVVAGRRTRVGRTISIHGTAFGVAPGRVVTARHVVSPTRREIAKLVAVPGLAIPSDPAKVRIVATRPRTLTLVPAHAPGDPDAATPSRVRAKVAELSDAVTDLALLRIPDTDAPTLALNDTLTRGTPAAVIGFGGQAQGIPAVRAGTLDGPREIEGTDNDGFGGFEGEVLPGDSGAPVVDSAGQAHGVVLRLDTKTAPTPVIARAESVRKLLAQDGATPAENAATSQFRAAMSAFWRRDYAPAATNLALLNDAGPAIPLVRYEQARANRLKDAPYAVRVPSRRRGVILAVGAMATLSAAALGAIRIRRQPLLP